MKEAKVRVGYSMLSGRIAPRICLTMDDALTAVKETINWNRLRLNDSEWYPIGRESTLILFFLFLTRIFSTQIGYGSLYALV